MGTLNAIYVRCPQATLTPHLEGGERIVAEAGLPFVAIELAPLQYQAPRARLERLSKLLATDVVWLSFQSTVDALHYVRWASGTLVRELMGNNEGWVTATGAIEPWEDETKAVKSGSLEPFIDARGVAAQAAEHLRLPGWEVASG